MTWRCSLASASNVKENENISLLWAADYFGRPSFFYLQSVIYPPPFLQPSTFRLLLFAKFNTKILSFPLILC